MDSLLSIDRLWTVEELETTNEELQSTNEELETMRLIGNSA